MPFSNEPWESPEAQLDPAAYCRVCLIDMNGDGEKLKDNCKLPIRREPGAAINKAAVHAAAAALAGARGGLKVPAIQKRKAARTLLRYYREMGETPPESVLRMARERV